VFTLQTYSGFSTDVQSPRTETAPGSYIPDRERYGAPLDAELDAKLAVWSVEKELRRVDRARCRALPRLLHRIKFVELILKEFALPEADQIRAAFSTVIDAYKAATTDQEILTAFELERSVFEPINRWSDPPVDPEVEAEARNSRKVEKKSHKAAEHQAAEAEAEARLETARQAAIAEHAHEETDRAAREAAEKERLRQKAERRAAERAAQEAERLRQFRERHCKPARQGVPR
jgi:hypothetical protein